MNLDDGLKQIFSLTEVPNLTFSWEENSEHNLQSVNQKKIIDEAVNVMKKTKYVVIIGYSFPYFNRTIDKRLLSFDGFSPKVYIQDKNAEGIRNILSTVFRLDNGKTETNIDINNFLLPPEL